MSRRYPLGPLADVALIVAFIVLVILGYVVLIGVVGRAIVSDVPNLPFPGQYP
jgi:hypothetical protein